MFIYDMNDEDFLSFSFWYIIIVRDEISLFQSWLALWHALSIAIIGNRTPFLERSFT